MIDAVIEVRVRDISLANLVVNARAVQISVHHVTRGREILNYIFAVVDKVKSVMAVLAPLDPPAKRIVFVNDRVVDRPRMRANTRYRYQCLSETTLKVVCKGDGVPRIRLLRN